jgi:hypothetical protein
MNPASIHSAATPSLIDGGKKRHTTRTIFLGAAQLTPCRPPTRNFASTELAARVPIMIMDAKVSEQERYAKRRGDVFRAYPRVIRIKA